jgi:beta-lactamase superfamily II metal-dependent hydrolase
VKKGEHAMKDVVAAVIDDLRDSDNVPRVDLVIGTHRHRDHVSGFGQDAWEEVEVGEVWMPWTEDPNDEDATRIREMQASLAIHLQATMDRRREVASARNDAAAAALAEEWALVAANALSNEAGMTQLHEGFGKRAVKKPRFLPGKKQKDSETSKFLPGVTIFVMGPSRSDDVIRDMEPGEGESYLHLASTSEPGREQPPALFREQFAVSDADFLRQWPHLACNPTTLEALHEANADDLVGVLGALEKAVNGTSLMLMFRIGRTHLLFPGDAQWGTWREALNNPRHRALLAKTDFYKIGHHGSHNATPPEFVEKVLGKDFRAMASVKPVSNWPEIPREPLLDALRLKSDHVARSDETDDAGQRGFTVGEFYVETRIPIR